MRCFLRTSLSSKVAGDLLSRLFYTKYRLTCSRLVMIWQYCNAGERLQIDAAASEIAYQFNF